jgi:hypothetical protein
MKFFCALVMIALLGVLVFTAIDAARPEKARMRAARLKIGDNKARVQTVMGKPLYMVTNGVLTQFLFSAPAERWVYGSLLDWDSPSTREFPWIAPLNLRLFCIAETNDVVICFDAEEKVSGIKTPPAR